MFLQVTEMRDLCDVYVEPVHKTTESIITESKQKSGNSVIYNLESFPHSPFIPSLKNKNEHYHL